MTQKRTGFSLIEMLLAIAIFAVIAALSAGILFAAHQSWERIAESAGRQAMRGKLDYIADRMLRNALAFDWPDAEGREKPIFCGKPDFIRFATRHGIYSDTETGLRFAELLVEDEKLFVNYRRWPLDGEESEQIQREVFADKVKSVRFQYAIREKGAIIWLPEFLPQESGEFPLAIRMNLEFTDGTQLKYLRRTAGNAQYSSFGKYREDTCATVQ